MMVCKFAHHEINKYRFLLYGNGSKQNLNASYFFFQQLPAAILFYFITITC